LYCIVLSISFYTNSHYPHTHTHSQVQNRVGEGVAVALEDGKKTNNIKLHCSIL
jgi:hypothetical protein